MGPSLNWAQTHQVRYDGLVDELERGYKAVQSAYAEYDQAIDVILDRVQRDIDVMETRYFADSQRLYENDFRHEQPDYVLDRRLQFDASTREYLLGRIQLFSDWRHAGMILHPGREDWVEHLVGCDPLYLVDVNTELLIPARDRFNEQYRKRLRLYSIRESTDPDMMSRIPQSQFGYCLAYNFFNYRPMEIVEAYLTQIYQRLRPGGVLAFTFNDCDRHGAVELTERFFMCYTPGSLIEALCDRLGFVTREKRILDNASTWLEVAKPGNFSTLRGGQTLARVVADSK
jgi:SAM-dependent methyltransferase